ncbi:hypothetical protein OAF54_00930 [bacterium]|nr:hypothetical protein [bacterium]
MATLNNQGLRQESFRTIGSTTYAYNGDMVVACDAVSAQDALTANGKLFSWLGDQGQTELTLSGRQNGFAIAKGFTSWNNMGAFTV